MHNKGDIRSQRQRRRRRDRYRGCHVCGVHGAQCTECGLGEQLVAIHGYASLSLIVDGSFIESKHAERRVSLVEGKGQGLEPGCEAGAGPLRGDPILGHGGAGLVLVRVHGNGETILASRACGFRASSSSDAEFHAVIRAASWAPGVAIYTDARDLPVKMVRVNPDLVVHYLNPNDRAAAYMLAHRLSVEGRCREAPETTPAVGIEFAAGRPQRSKGARRRMGAVLLLEHAGRDPSFDGDFTALAERLGWTSGRLWRRNPAIQIATKRWLEQRATMETDKS